LKKLAEEHKSNIDELILKKLAEQEIDATTFHGLDSVVFDKFGFSVKQIADLNILLDLVRAKRNGGATIHQDPFAVGDNERLRQELNDLRKLYQDHIDKSNKAMAELKSAREDAKKR
jgi:hypothetical protein